MERHGGWYLNGDASDPFILRTFKDLSWSPDGQTVAFRSNMDPSGYDFFYTVPVGGGDATRLDHTLSPMGIKNEPTPLNPDGGPQETRETVPAQQLPTGMDLLAHAPEFWMFRTDPDMVGQTEKWFAPSTKGEPWIASSTHDYWEADHIGDGWYAVDLVIPYVEGKRIWLQFGAVDETYTLWINGEYVGDNLDAGTSMWDQPVSVEISGQFKEGQSNHVVVRVRNTDASGGIWKPVRVLVEEQGAKTAAADTQTNVLCYNQTLHTLIEQRQWPPRSRWDTLVASPGVEPVIKGSYRLPNGWDFETYDRNRRDIAEAIIMIQEALAQ